MLKKLRGALHHHLGTLGLGPGSMPGLGLVSGDAGLHPGAPIPDLSLCDIREEDSPA